MSKTRTTQHVRLASDLAMMLAAIGHQEFSNTPAILESLIRNEIEQRYAALPAHVRRTAEERAKARRQKKQPAA
jgi:hypothetical protein